MVTLGRERDVTQIIVAGRLAAETVEARLAMRSRTDIAGSLAVSRLSLPWLTSVAALNASSAPQAASLWSTSRFGPLRRGAASGQIAIKAARLDLGRGLSADAATLTAALSSEGLALREIGFGLGGGRVTGSLAVTRQGSLASLVAEGTVKDVPLATLTGPGAVQTRLSGALRLGGSGESVAALVANLGGSGTLQLADLEIGAAESGAVEQALARALRDSDPLGPRRLDTMVVEELARGPFAGTAPAAQATVVGGALRLGPLAVAATQATWEGTATFDLKALRLDARGTLRSNAPPPRGWQGSAPAILLGWQGPLGALKRDVDVAPLTNGLAAIVLQRELDKVEAFEADMSERARLNSRRDMEQARRVAEEAARLQRLREQAEAERLRLAEEAARREREQPSWLQPLPTLPPSLAAPPQPGRLPNLPTPLEIRPAPQIRPQPPGG